jgi:predicted peptidase
MRHKGDFMNRFLCFLFCLTLGQSGLRAAKPEAAFEARTFQDGDFTLPYRIFVPPNLKAGEKVPLVLFFHGAGERGDNNIRQLHHAIPGLFSFLEKNAIPAIVVAPQCPSGKQWVNVPWGGLSHTMPAAPSAPMHAAMALLQDCLKTLPVDNSRVYVCGISMGGFGTWDIAQREPGIFAAALPVCGGGDLAEAPKLKDLPIWTFHGELDETVKTIRSRDMVAALKAAGGSPKYTEYPGVTHNSWTRTFADEEVLKWLFAQKKSPATP